MTRQVEAVYENGVLRPLEPLPFEDRQRVTVTVSDTKRSRGENWRDVEYMEKAAAQFQEDVSLEEVRRRLSKIPGSLTADFIAEREDR
jgi:predicted DNA-binding antitoxin AbrB/MazE fold protein